jgi:hypothetical protein
MHLIYFWVPLNRAYFCRISGCEQPGSMSQIITNLDNLLNLFRTTRVLMTHKYRRSQQSSREVKPKFIDSTQEEQKNIYNP